MEVKQCTQEQNEGTSCPKLDIPSEQISSIRRQVMVQKLLKENSKFPPMFERVEGSSVLAQVKSFLPKLKIANAELDKSDTTTEIGIVPPDQKNYIEMNLQLYEESSDSGSEDDSSELQSGKLAEDLAKPPLRKPLILDITDEGNSKK